MDSDPQPQRGLELPASMGTWAPGLNVDPNSWSQRGPELPASVWNQMLGLSVDSVSRSQYGVPGLSVDSNT
ncbi:hypothetical protein chiPu_0022885 [Chiloscyllium punctatum]|uniref:Uncharacterized protein n=1 Tax=Chiloscyllium punctatum TaxID=137246 RepID=A0A401T9Z1_CHIPU|nr:hypothetical protein [Chiloscyllium punctatum]